MKKLLIFSLVLFFSFTTHNSNNPCFDEIDSDDSNCLGTFEYESIAYLYNVIIPSFEEADTNGDGCISLNEFEAVYQCEY